MSRTMKIVEYGDAYTTRALSSNQQKYNREYYLLKLLKKQ